MNGHNPRANRQPDDFQDIRALLQELPRVSAPADFNANLKARIAAAKVETNEFADVMALVKELPRVSAPPDFDFKLRARIAQAKAEEQKSSKGWLAELFGQSFSWLQASATMAAVAIVVSVVSFGVLRGERPIDTAAPSVMAQNPNNAVSSVATTGVATDPIEPLRVPARASESIPRIPKPQTIKYPPVSSHPSSSNGAEIGQRSSSVATAGATKVMIKHQSGEARMINLSEYNLGLQTAQFRSTPRATANSLDTAAVANIY